MTDLSDLLSYDPVSGHITWLIDRGPVKKGQRAGTVSGDGYRNICVDYKIYREHRVAYYLMTGKWPDKLLDHRNRDRSDNRWENIRPATTTQNNYNTPVRSNNKSGYKGVSYFSRTGRWVAHISINGKHKHLGYFDTPEEAAAEYQRKARETQGDFIGELAA